MATRRIVLDDGTERIYKEADVVERHGALVVMQDEQILKDKYLLGPNDSIIGDMLAQYPPGTWKYWETIE